MTQRPARVVVVGNSGSGKTTFARQLAARLDAPCLEMDSVFHRAGWDQTPDDEFQAELDEFTSTDRWVVDGNYTSHGTREVVWPRADTFIWLDLPRRVTTYRVVKRTLRRVFTREELWTGVVEPWTNLYSLDPYKNIIVWTWTMDGRTRRKYETVIAEGRWEHAEFHRLRSVEEADRFLRSVG
jgi:adenylate kinase family enzyme